MSKARYPRSAPVAPLYSPEFPKKLGDLQDVSVPAPADGDRLGWIAADGMWGPLGGSSGSFDYGYITEAASLDVQDWGAL